jgi:hypothetical protein
MRAGRVNLALGAAAGTGMFVTCFVAGILVVNSSNGIQVKGATVRQCPVGAV